ncbi:MAG: archaeosortase A [Candidatus Thermoplasmatota archaeon]|nr:archaeosortase A [Candidatus Thermoplasmatota archaeon]
MEDIVSTGVQSLGEIFGLDFGQTTLIVVAIGLACLGLSFHSKKRSLRMMAPLGWICIGLYFYMGADHYFEINDPVLIFMSLAALPVCIAYAGWEAILFRESRTVEAVDWLRGAVFWSAMPYLAIQHIPVLNAGLVWFTAWITSVFLQWSGAADIHLGEMMVDVANSTTVTWSEWEGSRWILTDTLGDRGFYVPMTDPNGDEVGIGIILGCSALQSMIVFVGAIVAVQNSPWKRRARALLVSIPVVFVLNVFRNAGIIWLVVTYGATWELFGLGVYDFSHAYAAKFLSLGAMFLMALVLFDLLPKLHENVISVMNPLFRIFGTNLRNNSS